MRARDFSSTREIKKHVEQQTAEPNERFADTVLLAASQDAPPMMLVGTGSSKRQALVLVLHDSSKPMSSFAPDWTPAALCSEGKPGT
jgi:hypothetical protein